MLGAGAGEGVVQEAEARNLKFCSGAGMAPFVAFIGQPPAKIHSINYMACVVEFVTGLSVELRVLGFGIPSPFLHYLALYQLWKDIY